MIYFILSPAMNKVKIGRSKHPKFRMEKMQAHSADRLVLLAIIDGPASIEAQLHTAFMDHHSHGEWFSYVPVIADVVRSIGHGRFSTDWLPVLAKKAWCHERANRALADMEAPAQGDAA